MCRLVRATPVALEWGKPFVFRFVSDTLERADVQARSDANDHAAVGTCSVILHAATSSSGESGSTRHGGHDLADGCRHRGAERHAGAHCRGTAGVEHTLAMDGVRAVPHLPCRFDCDATRRSAAGFSRTRLLRRRDGLVARDPAVAGRVSAFTDRRDQTPIMKVSTRTDAPPRSTCPPSGDPTPRGSGLGFPIAPHALHAAAYRALSIRSGASLPFPSADRRRLTLPQLLSHISCHLFHEAPAPILWDC